MEKILICFGTRPEWLKIKPLLLEIDNYKLLFTGQHQDLLCGIDVDYKISINPNHNRLDQLISDCLLQFPDIDFDSILVQGDTASAFACALAAFHRKKKIFYLEAGLRSFDFENPFPEEGYRQMIARIANVNFCPTELSRENLLNENVFGKCYVVGNTVLDNLLSYKEKIEYSNKVLVTLHRRENHGLLENWFSEINLLAQENPELDFIFPMHPNPFVQKYKYLLKNVHVVDPLEHEDLLEILVKSRLVITDSGGLQEEATFFNKRVIICRKTTERPEGLTTGHLVLCSSPEFLEEIFYRINEKFKIDEKCPYGDGHSSERIKKIIQKNEF